MLVGTKLDDVENRKVQYEEALEISRQFQCISYYETSSQSGENVDEAFFSVAARAFQKKMATENGTADLASAMREQ